MENIRAYSKPVSEIVQSDYRTADVFEKHGINYACNKHILLPDACLLQGINFNKVVEDLAGATRMNQLHKSIDFDHWKVDFLTDYIVNVHHAYLNHTLPVLKTALLKFIEEQKSEFREMENVLKIFQELSALLEVNNKYEEETIFPYIKNIESLYRRKESYAKLFVRTLNKPLGKMDNERTILLKRLKELQEVTNNYSFTAHACIQQQIIFHKLREFHEDIIQHKHLENDILFPRAIQMEKELLQA